MFRKIKKPLFSFALSFDIRYLKIDFLFSLLFKTQTLFWNCYINLLFKYVLVNKKAQPQTTVVFCFWGSQEGACSTNEGNL
jgi:hypothetical protein